MRHYAKSVRYKGLAYSYVRNTAHWPRFYGNATSMSRTYAKLLTTGGIKFIVRMETEVSCPSAVRGRSRVLGSE
jgi:hypothetical protein